MMLKRSKKVIKQTRKIATRRIVAAQRMEQMNDIGTNVVALNDSSNITELDISDVMENLENSVSNILFSISNISK